MNIVRVLNFRTKQPQLYDHTPWHREPRVCHYDGMCTVCQRRTYRFLDGGNDPRGPLGDHAAAPLLAKEYGCVGQDIPLCFPCANEYEAYQTALYRARFVWRYGPAHANAGDPYRG